KCPGMNPSPFHHLLYPPNRYAQSLSSFRRSQDFRIHGWSYTLKKSFVNAKHYLDHHLVYAHSFFCQLELTKRNQKQRGTEMTTYTIKGSKTSKDVVNDNDEILETGYTEEEAQIAIIGYQRDFGYTAV